MAKSAPQETQARPLLTQQSSLIHGLIGAIFVAVILLEYSTPPPFVFGYLYTGAIVLGHRRLTRRQVIGITLAAAALTLFNLVFPNLESYSLPTVANRLIAVAALLVTGYLTERNRFYEDQITRQQAHIQAQEKLANLREDFVWTLTHDLKTPLLGAIETINSFYTEQFGAISPTQGKVLQMMQRSHRSTLKLVEALLDVYRNDAEGLGLNLSPVNLRSLLEETVTELTQLAQTRRVHIQLTSHGQDFWVNGDELELRRVFENLLSNAITHTARSTRVEVWLDTIGQQQQVQVCDRGPGITTDELPHLFERFYQGYSNRQAKGTGLGLYLSRQIIEAHSGKIWAENRDPRGAVFYCRLPAMSANERR